MHKHTRKHIYIRHQNNSMTNALYDTVFNRVPFPFYIFSILFFYINALILKSMTWPIVCIFIRVYK